MIGKRTVLKVTNAFLILFGLTNCKSNTEKGLVERIEKLDKEIEFTADANSTYLQLFSLNHGGYASLDHSYSFDDISAREVVQFVDTDEQTAIEAPYDNTTSGLNTINVQESIDKLVEQSVFNTAYIEDYGAIADDGLDDGAAIQSAIDLNKSGSINYILSRTGGDFVVSSGSLDVAGVKDLKIKLHPGANLEVTGNFPLMQALFSVTSGDRSVTNLEITGFSMGSSYDANANGGTNGSSDGSDPNPVNPATIWFAGIQLDGFKFNNMNATNPGTNGYFIKCHNESGTAFTKNVEIDHNQVKDLGGMFVEIINHATPLEFKWENVYVHHNKYENLGIFDHGIATSLSGTGRNGHAYANTYKNLTIGLELLGAQDFHWHDETFLEGVDHFWSFSKNLGNDTAPNKNITVSNIISQHPLFSPNIVEHVHGATFENIKMLGGGQSAINTRHSKNITYYKPEIIGEGYGQFTFTGDNATNAQANENIRIFNPTILGNSAGGNPLITVVGDQVSEVTIIGGSLENETGALFASAGGNGIEPTYENVKLDLNGTKSILYPYASGGGTGDMATSVYDADENGIIDQSALPSAGISTTSGYYIQRIGNDFTAHGMSENDSFQTFAGTNLDVIFTSVLSEYAAKRPTDQNPRIVLGEGKYPLNNVVWNVSGSSSNVSNGLTIEGQGRGAGTTIQVLNPNAYGFKTSNNASITIKNLDVFVAPVASGLIESSSTGTNKTGVNNMIIENVFIRSFGEGDVLKLINPFNAIISNTVISSRNGTPIHLRNELEGTFFGNSTIKNCRLFYGDGTEDRGILSSTSSTDGNGTVKGLNDLQITNVKSLAYAGEAGENNGGVLSSGEAAEFIGNSSLGIQQFDAEYAGGVLLKSVRYAKFDQATYIFPKSKIGENKTALYIDDKTKAVYFYGTIDGIGIDVNGHRDPLYVKPFVIENAPSYEPRITMRGTFNGNFDVTTIEVGKDRVRDINMDWDGKEPYVNVTTSIDGTHNSLFEQAFRKERTVNYVIVGDSRRDAYYNRYEEYIGEQLAKINISVNNNSESGQSIENWLANIHGPSANARGTLDECLSFIPGNGENNIVEFSMGWNDTSRPIAEYEILYQSVIDSLLAARPNLTIHFVVPDPSSATGKDSDLRKSMANVVANNNGNHRIKLIDTQAEMATTINNPDFYWDLTHQSYFGSIKNANLILEKSMPGNILKHITLEDLEPYAIGPTGNLGVVESGGWLTWNYNEDANTDKRRFAEIDNLVENAILQIDATFNNSTLMLYDESNTLIKTYFLSRYAKGSNLYEITIPKGAVKTHINLHDNGATWDELGETPTIIYKQDPVTLTQDEINEGITLTQPKVAVSGEGTAQSLSLDGQDLTISEGNTVTLPAGGSSSIGSGYELRQFFGTMDPDADGYHIITGLPSLTGKTIVNIELLVETTIGFVNPKYYANRGSFGGIARATSLTTVECGFLGSLMRNRPYVLYISYRDTSYTGELLTKD